LFTALTLFFQSRTAKLNNGKQIMKRLALALFVTMAFAVSAMADSKIACEGILEHGSGGEYIASKNKPTCWLGADFTCSVGCLQTWRTPQNYGCFYHL
jgi:hypothetical protein